MSIAVSVQNWKFTARHNGGGIRQESAPQSANAYSFETLAVSVLKNPESKILNIRTNN